MTAGLERSKLRILLYGHDTYGLGHIRRNTAVGARLIKDFDNSSALLITGSPLAHCFVLPKRFDYVKIPSVTKDDTGQYRSRYLHLDLEEITGVRQAIIRETALTYRPDVFIVDHSPAGMTDEIKSTLPLLKEKFPQTKIILGLRDIIDEGEKIQRVWKKSGVYDLLRDVYDHIVVYGSQTVCDVLSEYGITGEIREKVTYAGYISREEPIRARDSVRRELEMVTDRLVLLTIGGGEDGYPIIDNYLKALKAFEGDLPFDTLIITGPFMSEENRRRILDQCDPRWPIRITDFTNDFLSYLNASDLVVSMGGYNTVCELLTLRKQAIIVPRVYPRTEQLLRAERLSRMGLLRMIHPNSLGPLVLHREILLGLGRPAATPGVLEMDGLSNVSKLVGGITLSARPGPQPKVIQKC